MDFSVLHKNLQPLEAADETAKDLSDILTMLTPSNIDMVVYNARQLQIDTAESLKQCVDVIFEHAISESSSLAAVLCTKLFFSSVPVCKETQKMKTFKEQIVEKSQSEVSNFVEKQELINLRLADDDSESAEEVSQNSCLRKLRRPMALFRFIGELYLVDFLPSCFVERCVTQLLDEASCNESTLETLCALLKLAGSKLELTDKNSALDLSNHFELLKDRKSSIVINPHTRFMIEELFAIRSNHWEPVNDIDWIMLYNLFLCDVEEKLYVLELWYGKW